MIDCRSEEGKTIGLIDSIITFCYFILDRELKDYDVQQALLDLRDNEGFKKIAKEMSKP